MAVINGMDDVIKYIKDQDETIKKLKEENEGLKKKLDEGTEQHLAQTKKLNNFYMKTKEENEKLKTKIEDLDEKIVEQEYEIEEKREIIDDLDEYKDNFEDMEEELANKSLEFKEKIEDSESTMRGAMDGFMKCQKDYDTLKSKIEKLKEMILAKNNVIYVNDEEELKVVNDELDKIMNQ
jgi:chromosome segregation ATPase